MTNDGFIRGKKNIYGEETDPGDGLVVGEMSPTPSTAIQPPADSAPKLAAVDESIPWASRQLEPADAPESPPLEAGDVPTLGWPATPPPPPVPRPSVPIAPPLALAPRTVARVAPPVPRPDAPTPWAARRAGVASDRRAVELGHGTVEAEATDLDFHQPGSFKVGIVGGKATGKTYLFQSLIWRMQNPDAAGSLTRFVRGGHVDLFQRIERTGKAARLNTRAFANEYRSWLQLPGTVLSTQTWYRFTVHYPIGLLGRFGRKRTRMDLEFLDASGEGLAEPIETRPEMATQWKQAFLDAQVMIFCLPIWAVFPYDDLDEPSLEFRKLLLDQYHQVLTNYLMTREHALAEKARLPAVQAILALTMADDDRCRITEVRERWIKPYAGEDIQYVLEKMGTERGLVQYLDDARAMSEALRQAFRYNDDPEIQAIPGNLRFGGSDPWIIPVSAIDGRMLETLKDRGYSAATRSALPPPRPAHVELPVLLALMQRHNAWS